MIPFANPRKRIVLTQFFIHELGERRLVRKILEYLMNNNKIALLAQSPHELSYYAELAPRANVTYYPYCQNELTFKGEYGQGEKYIFSGGYTNRDYSCLLEAATEIESRFIVVCSSLNKVNHKKYQNSKISILLDRKPEEFYGYLSNAKIVVIPLKENTGASGQQVALAAMSLGKPVVYTDVSVVSQYFQDETSGLSYKRGNASDLRNKIERLMQDKRLRQYLGDNARKQHRRCYRKKNYWDKLTEILVEA
jgi:glycosyltransferase involved in cell wall biosynthesis